MNYSEATIDTLYTAWEQGLDYVELENTLFVCFADGIWTMPLGTVILSKDNRIERVIKPGKPWGYMAD